MHHTRCRARLGSLTCLVLWAITASLVVPAEATVYFVDAEIGLDSNNGQSPEPLGKDVGPWRSLKRATRSRLAPGDSVLLRRGHVFREPLIPRHSGAADASITFAAYGDGPSPTVSGAEVVDAWTPGELGRYHAAWSVRPTEVVADGRWLRPVEAPNYLEPDTWFYEHVGKRLYVRLVDDRDPGVARVEASVRDKVLFIWDATHLLFEDLIIEMAAGDFEGVFNRGRHNVFESITSRFHHRSGLKITGTGAMHCRVSNGEFYANGSSGIDIESSRPPLKISHIELSGNRCFDNRWSWGQDGYGIKLTWTDHSIVRGNECFDNVSSGINLDGGGVPVDGCDHNVVESNESHGNGASGIELEFSSDDNDIRYNYCHDNTGETYWGAGIMITEGSSNNRVAYNIVRNQGGTGHCYIAWNGASASTFENNLAVSTKPANIGFYLENGPVARNTKLFNNVYHGLSAALYVDTNDPSGFVSDFNCWYRTTSGRVVAWNHIWMTLDDFRADHQQELSSITLDPRLVDPSSGDFGLAASSPCIDAGVDVGHVRDAIGGAVPAHLAPDLGAVEHQKSIY